jgi:hypothetical protein
MEMEIGALDQCPWSSFSYRGRGDIIIGRMEEPETCTVQDRGQEDEEDGEGRDKLEVDIESEN